MSKMTMRLWTLVFASVFSLNLHAAERWTTSTCAPADWTKIANNLVAGANGTISGAIATSFSTNDPKLLTDGSVPTVGGKEYIVGFQNGTSITWDFASPKVLDGVRVSCGYLAGATYSCFTVSKIEVKYFGATEWIEVAGEGKMSSTGKTDIHMQVFADGSGKPIAEGIGGLRVTFGQPPVGYANYCCEIEAVGSAQITGPVLKQVNVTPAITKAKIVGSLADVGTDATACDVYLSLNGAASVKVVEGVTNSFEYQIQNLTPDTEYAYELTFVNNAASPRQTVTSDAFTTLAEGSRTAKWDTSVCAPADWTALKGNLIKGKTGTTSGTLSYLAKDVTRLTDGVVPNPAAATELCGFCNSSSINWTFDEGKTLVELRLSAQSAWGNTYHRIWVDAVKVKYSEEGEWEALNVSSLQYRDDSIIGGDIPLALLTDIEAGILAENIWGLQIDFTTDGTFAFYYAEIEATGYSTAGEASAPELAEPEVETPTATKAIVSDALTSLGQTAMSASLTFAWGTDPEALCEPILLTDNASVGTAYCVTLTNLTPSATYYYAFAAKNDVVETATIKDGQFTMPELTYLDCAIVIPAGTVAVRVGETVYTESATVSVLRGEEISLRAVPAAGYVFERWTGDVAASQTSANPLTFVVNQPCSLTPIVRLASESVTVTWNGGAGAWEDATQWDRGFVPTPSDVVVISNGTCTVVEQVSVASLSVSGDAKLVVAEMNSGHYGNLAVAGDLVLSDTAELSVAAGPLVGDQYTFATGSGFVTIGGAFEIKDAAKFVPCCDQYTGGGVVTRAGRFVLASGASVEAISKGYAWFKDLTPNSCALGSPTGSKANNGWWGASYGGQGDTYGGGTGVRGNTGVEPYGFANAPVHPGSHKYNEQQKNNDPRAGGGSVRIHAACVSLAGKIDVTTDAVATSGAPSGGGIWITASKQLAVGPTTQLLAKGGDSPSFGNANGGGGRIAFGLQLTDEEIAALAATGELPAGSKAAVRGEEEFLADYPDVTISLDGGKATDKEDEPLEVCRGTFRFLVGQAPGLLFLIK